MKNLVIIDSNISDVEDIVSSLTDNTDYILFNYHLDTFKTICSRIKQPYENVSIIQHKYNVEYFCMVQSMQPAILFENASSYDETEEKYELFKNTLSICDPSLNSWQDYIQNFLIPLKENGAKNIDLLACELWSDENWVYAIDYIKENYDIHIRASLDITGAGGDFILESDNIDTVGLYFTEDILDYKYSFVGIDYSVLLSTKPPWGIYSATNWDASNNKLKELRGLTAKDATTSGTITRDTVAGNGSGAPITYIGGNTTATVVWPAGSIPANFTVCSITRKSILADGRVLNSIGSNWLHGHWGTQRGVAHYNTWYTSGTIGTITDWLVMCGKLTGTSPYHMLVDGRYRGTSTSGSGNAQLAINQGTYSEPSNFEFSYLVIWDQVLTDTELMVVNLQLNNYLSNGILPPVTYSSNIFTKFLYNNPPWGIYSATNWSSSTNTLNEMRGISARNATTSGVSTVSASGNGASSSVTYLQGTTTSTVTWPFNSISPKFTVVSLTRYVGNNRNRILTSTGGEWIHGHFSGSKGYVYYNGNAIASGITTNLDIWAITAGSSNGTLPFNVLLDGSGIGTSLATASSSYGLQMGINTFSTEKSDFAFSYIFIWDKELTFYEMRLVSDQLTTYLSAGTLPQITYSLSAPTLNSIVYDTSNLIVNFTPSTSTLDTSGIYYYYNYTNASSVPLHTVPFVNGFFGFPQVTDNSFSYVTSIPGWNLSASVGTSPSSYLMMRNTGSVLPAPSPLPTNVTQFMGVRLINAINKPASLSQSLFLSPGTYTFTFSMASAGASFYNANHVVSVSVGSNTLLDRINLSNSWTNYSYDVSFSTFGKYTILLNTYTTSNTDTSIFIAGVNFVYKTSTFRSAFNPNLIQNNYFFGNVLASANTFSNVTAISNWTLSTTNNSNSSTPFILVAGNNAPTYTSSVLPKDVWQYVGFRISTANLNATLSQSFFLNPGNYNLSYYTAIKPNSVTSIASYISITLPGTGIAYCTNALSIIINPLTTTLQGGSQSTALPVYAVYLEGGDYNGSSVDWLVAGFNGTTTNMIHLNVNISSTNLHAYVNIKSARTITSDYTIGVDPVLLNKAWNSGTPVAVTTTLGGAGFGISRFDYYISNQNVNTYLESYPLEGLNNTSKTACVGAFSLQRIYNTYTGPTIKVRRSVDSSNVDFYADSIGNMGTGLSATGTSLESWLNTSTGFITIWYDQSGKGNHATQSNTSIQPIIDPSNKWIDFKSSRYFTLPNGTVPSGNSSYTVTYRHNTINTSNGGVLGSGNYGTNGQTLAFRRNNTQYATYWWNIDTVFGTYSTGNMVTETYVSTSRLRTGYINGTSVSTKTETVDRASTTANNTIGVANSTEYMNGELYNVYIFNTALSNNERGIVERSIVDTSNQFISLSNNNFNIPTLSTNSYTDTYTTSGLTFTGWGYNLNTGRAFGISNGSASPWCSATLPYGISQFFFAQVVGNSYPSMSFYKPVTLTPGNYSLSFFYSARSTTNTTVYYSSVSIGTKVLVNALYANVNLWQETTYNFNITSTEIYNLTFSFFCNQSSAGDHTFCITGVNIARTNYLITLTNNEHSAISWLQKSYDFNIPYYSNYNLTINALNATATETVTYLTALNLRCNSLLSPFIIQNAPDSNNAIKFITIDENTYSSDSNLLSLGIESPVITSITAGVGVLYVYFTFSGGVADSYTYSTDGTNYSIVNGITSPLTISGLTNGTTYNITIKATLNGVSSFASNSVSGTPQGPPSSPTIDSLVAGDRQLTINYTAGFNGGTTITSYTYTLIIEDQVTTTVNAGTDSPIVITGLLNNVSYSVFINAINAIGTSPNSNTLSSIPIGIPYPPTIIDFSEGNKEASIFFESANNGGYTIVDYKYSLNGGAYISSGNVITSPLTITGLVNLTTYSVSIVAVNTFGNSVPSNFIGVTPSGEALPPTLTSVTVGNSQLSIAFTPPSNNGGYAITNYYYSTNNGNTYSLANTVHSPYTITGLTNGTQYTIRFITVNTYGNSVPSSSIVGTPSTVPDAPSVTLTPFNGYISVAFTVNSNGGNTITSYKYSLNNASFILLDDLSSPFIVSGLTNGLSYSIRMIAINSRGDSTTSASVSTTPIGNPPPPTITSIEPFNNSMIIYFNPPITDGGYALTTYKYALNTGASYTSMNTTASPFTVTGLTTGLNYSVNIVATNTIGDSSASNVVTATPKNSINYEKALSLEWNGQVFVLSVRNEMNMNVDYLYSYDGYNWTGSTDLSNSTFLTSENAYNVKWLGSSYVMMGNITNSAGNTLLKSMDGVNYSPITTYSPGIPVYDLEKNIEHPHSITFPKNIVVALGGIASSSTKIAYSYDEGVNWTPVTGSSQIFNVTANNAFWNSKIWVAVGSSINTIATSPDGVNWIGRGAYIFTTAGYCVAWSKETMCWVAGGEGLNSLAYSSDGIFWTGVGNGLLSAVYDIFWNGNMFVAVGTPVQTNKCIAYSYNGMNWSLSNSNFNESSSNISWNGNNWICIGKSNKSIGISSDGINWSLSDISGLITPLRAIYSDKQVAVIVDASSNLGISNSGNFGNMDIRYNSATISTTTPVSVNIPAQYSANLVKHYKFETEDLSNNSLLNYANSTYEGTLSTTDIITSKSGIIGNASLNISDTYSLISNNYVNMGNVNANSLSGGLSISYWMRPSDFFTSTVVKSHSTLFELGNGRGQDTVGMYMFGNTLASNVINGDLSGQIMNFTDETTPFGTLTTAGNNTPGSTISTTVSNCQAISLTADGKRIIMISYSGFIYFSNYNTTTQTWGVLTRTYGNSVSNITRLKITGNGNRGVITEGSFIYYFDWIDSSNNYSQFIKIENITRGYQGVAISANGERIVASTGGGDGRIYYSDWNGLIYGATISVGQGGIVRTIDISPNSRVIAFERSGGFAYRIWNGTAYSGETTISSPGIPNNIRFSSDSNIIFWATNNSPRYTLWNNTTNTYSGLITTTLSSTLDYILFDVTADGTIYYGSNNSYIRSRKFSFTNQDIGLISSIDISNTSNTWRNVTWTISPSGIYKYYIDASLVFTDTSGIYPSTIARTNNYIGTYNNSHFYPFNGGIDDFMILNRELTQTDVSNIIVYKNAQIALTAFDKNSEFAYNKLLLNKYYKFNTEDVSGGTRLLNYATNTYDATLSSSGIIDGTYKVNGSASLSLNGSNLLMSYVDISNVVPSTSALSFSFWMRPSSTKSHSTLFELGNGRGQDTIGMYLSGNTLATNVINGYLIDKTMNFTAEVTPFGTSTIAGSNTADTTITSTPTGTINITLTSNGKRMVLNTYGGYIYYSDYNSNSNTWGSLKRTYGSGSNLVGLRITANGMRGIVTGQNNYIYYFNWIDSSNNYSQLVKTLDNTTRNYWGATISKNGERIAVSIAGSHVYYSDWIDSSNNYGPLIQITSVTSDYRAVEITPDTKTIIYNFGTTYIKYRTWNGTTYANETDICSIVNNETWLNIKLSHDGNILFFTGSNTTTRFTYWNNNTNSFNGVLTDINTAVLPVADNWIFDVTSDGTIYYGSNGSYIRSRKFSFANQDIGLINDIDTSNVTNTWRHIAWTISSTGIYRYYLDSNLIYTDNSGIFPVSSFRSQNYLGYYSSPEPSSFGTTVYNCTFTSGGGAGISGTAGTTFKLSSNYSNVFLNAKIPIYAPGSNTTISYNFCTATYVYKANGVDISSVNVNIGNTIVSGTLFVSSAQTMVNIYTYIPVTLNNTTIYAIAFTSPVNIALQQTYNSIDVGTGVLFYTPTTFTTNLRMAGTIYVSNSTVYPQYIPYMVEYNGGIDDFVIYRKELSQSEISNIYKINENTGNYSYNSTSQIVRYYKFDTTDTSGTLLYNHATKTYDASFNTTLFIYYTFDSGSWNGVNIPNISTGIPVYDASAINTPSISTTNYKVGTGSLYMTGGTSNLTSNYIKINKSIPITTNGFSVSCWFNYPSTSGGWSRLFEFGNGQSSDNILYAPGNGVSIYKGASVALQPGGTSGGYADGTWKHFAMTINYNSTSTNTNTLVIYINGSAVYTNTTSPYPNIISRTQNFIGYSGWTENVIGYVDDFRVHNSVLSPSNVIDLLNTNSLRNNTSISLENTGNQFINLGTVSNIGGNHLSFSFNLRTYQTKSHSTIFELGNGRGQDTVAMYIMGNTIVTNVINGNLVGQIMNFTTETTPFGTTTTAGSNTVGSTISTTVTNWSSIAVTANNTKIVITSLTSGYMYFSDYNSTTQVWGPFTRTNGNSIANIRGLRITADGSKGVICLTEAVSSYIYYFNWVSNNYSQFTQTGDTTARKYVGVGISANGNRIVACENPGFVYYADWGTTNYGTFTQLTTTNVNYISVDISPNGNMVAYADSSGNIRYRIWNGTSYVNETLITLSVRTRSLRFSHDGNILFHTLPSQNITYHYWNKNTNTFTATYNSIPSTNQDNWTFDVTADGYLYYGGLNSYIRTKKYSFTNQDIGLTFPIDISNTSNSWRNITWTVSSTGTYKYYLDASLVYTDLSGIVPSSLTRINNYIGSSYVLDNSFGFLNYFNGGIDDFVIYNKELSQQEISSFPTTNQIKTVVPYLVTKNYTTRPSSSDYIIVDNSFNPNNPVLLIQKKSYTPSTTTATFNMNTTFNVYNNGNVIDVSYVGSPVNGNQTTWGPQQLFDNTTTAYDWATKSGESTYPFGTWSFPINVYVSNIFIIPRSSQDNFPSTVDLYVDNIKYGTYSNSTLVYGTTGHFINYNGNGININCFTSGKVWKLVYNNIPTYIGEIEFWGYVLSSKLLITTSEFNDISNSLLTLSSSGTSSSTSTTNYGYNFSTIANNSTYYLFSTNNRIIRNTKIFDISFADMSQNITSITDMSGSINHIAWNNPNIGTPIITPLTIACGQGANTLAYSYDGIYWSGLGKNIFTTRANKAIWNGTLWVAVGTGQYWVATSYDGISWVGRNSDLMTEAYDIAWNGSYMVAVGYGNNTIAVSRDGIQWYSVPNSKLIFTIRASAILWTSKAWVAYGSGTNKVMISYDPTAWIWTTPATRNPIFTDAITANSASNGVYNIYASSSSPTTPASNATDNTTSNWQTTASTYNATTGVYTGSMTTTYYDINKNQYTVSGEWIHVDYKSPFVADYYLLAWAIDSSNSQYTIPKKWTVLVSIDEDYTGTNTWGLLASYEYSGSLYPSNTYSYPYFVKLQNVNSNTINAKSYRIVIQNILPGGSNTFARIGEFNFYSKTEYVNPYVKPILTRTHLIYQTNATIFSATSDNSVSIVADLSGNVIDTSYNGGYYTTSIISGIKTPTSHCFDGRSIVMAPLQGNSVSFIKNTSLNTHLGTDFSLNGQLVNSINGNTYACCFNGKRIILGGSGTNKITYNTIIENSQSPVFTSSLNANSLFTAVYGLASNPGYGHVYCENRIYFNPGDKVSIVTPKAYSESIQQKTTITMNLHASNTVKNITLPSSTTIATIIGPRGPTGPIGVQPDGPIGDTGTQGVTGDMGPIGVTGDIGLSPQGETGMIGDYSSMDNTGPTGSIGNIGYRGITGITGQNGMDGSEGPTGTYGLVDPDNWVFDGIHIGTSDKTLTIGTDTLSTLTTSLEVLGNVRATTARNMFDLSYNDLIIDKINVGNTPITNASMSITGNVYTNNLFINTNSYSSAYTIDISGVLQTNKLKFPKIIQTYSLPIDISSSTITIDYTNSKQIWIDASSLEQHFSLSITGFSDSSYPAKIHNITLTIDYTNAVIGRYYCTSLNIGENSYPVAIVGGDPPTSLLTTMKTTIKQEINIVYVTNNIWKILSRLQLYE